jgi:hypothetical protein
MYDLFIDCDTEEADAIKLTKDCVNRCVLVIKAPYSRIY